MRLFPLLYITLIYLSLLPLGFHSQMDLDRLKRMF